MPSSTPNFQHRVRMEEIRFDVSTSVEFCSVSSYRVCQVDGSGDCGDDMLKELYPDDDIPEDLIGFLDDKVSFFLLGKRC